VDPVFLQVEFVGHFVQFVLRQSLVFFNLLAHLILVDDFPTRFFLRVIESVVRPCSILISPEILEVKWSIVYVTYGLSKLIFNL